VLLGPIAQKLQTAGVQTLGVVATNPGRANLYFRFRPPRFAMGADAELATHRAYGLPGSELTPESFQVAQSAATRELSRLGQPVPADPWETLSRLDGFEATPTDEADLQRHQAQLTGQFLIDRDGVVRWANVECARSGPAGFGEMPSEEELLAAARAL
jgi:thioesterase domain-containing protein